MSLVLDPFDSMALGRAIPSGWSLAGLIANAGDVKAFSSGGIWPSHNFYDFDSSTGQLRTPTFGPITSFSAFFGFQISVIGIPFGTVICTANMLENDEQTQLAFINLSQEMDGSFSIRVNGSLVGNSGQVVDYGFPPQQWYFAEFDVSIGTFQIGKDFFISALCSLYIDGQLLINGTSNSTININSISLPTGISNIQWNAPILLSQITVNNYSPGTLPNPQTPKVRVSQLPIEVAKSVTSGNVRASQLVIEHVKAITSAKVRASQLVIEVATKGINPQQAQGWIVSES